MWAKIKFFFAASFLNIIYILLYDSASLNIYKYKNKQL